jgi:hypothetical protein
VFIHFDRWGDGVRVFVTAPALQQVDPDGAGAAVVTARLNELNRRHRFAKWLFDDGTLLAVHDLLGDHLHRDELLNAVYSLAGAAQDAADELAEDSGGLRYGDLVEVEDFEVDDD